MDAASLNLKAGCYWIWTNFAYCYHRRTNLHLNRPYLFYFQLVFQATKHFQLRKLLSRFNNFLTIAAFCNILVLKPPALSDLGYNHIGNDKNNKVKQYEILLELTGVGAIGGGVGLGGGVAIGGGLGPVVA